MDWPLIYLLLAVSTIGVCWKAGPVFACWFRARNSAAPIGILSLWSMYFRNVPLEAVVDAYVSARKARVRVRLADLALHARAGGDVRAAVYAYVETLRGGSRVEFARVCELELDAVEEDVDERGV